MEKPAKNTVCLWYDRDAEDAARFYAETFPDSSVTAVHRAPGDFPSGKQGADAAYLADRGTLRAGAKERILYERARTNQSVYCHST